MVFEEGTFEARLLRPLRGAFLRPLRSAFLSLGALRSTIFVLAMGWKKSSDTAKLGLLQNDPNQNYGSVITLRSVLFTFQV